MSPLPAAVARHFPGEELDLASPAGRGRLIGRLLEDGDRSDLAWLVRRVGPDEIGTWFDRHSARRLSRRSRAFWACVLARPLRKAPKRAEALWPLA